MSVMWTFGGMTCRRSGRTAICFGRLDGLDRRIRAQELGQKALMFGREMLRPHITQSVSDRRCCDNCHRVEAAGRLAPMPTIICAAGKASWLGRC